jgi:hypothetical protein
VQEFATYLKNLMQDFAIYFQDFAIYNMLSTQGFATTFQDFAIYFQDFAICYFIIH